MNKEDAKKQLAAESATISSVRVITTSRAKDIIDQIEPDHPKVKLPREVGEELDDWKFKWGIDVGEYLTSVCTSDEDTPKAQEWREAGYGRARSNQLADAYRYGWEAESEELFYVKTPDNWNGPGCEYPWIVKDRTGEGLDRACKQENDSRHQFTRAEFKQYHLDSDIFTLVPVEESK